MKKVLKTLTAIGTTALAVVGGICVYRKFFAKDEELDEVFEEDELMDEAEEEVPAFDSEEEIFEEEEAAAPAEEAEAPSAEEVVAVEAGCPEEAEKETATEE